MFQLENQYRLFDYSINLNDVIQLMVRTVVSKENLPKQSGSKITKNLKNETLALSSTSSPVSSIVNNLYSIELLKLIWINYLYIFRMIPRRYLMKANTLKLEIMLMLKTIIMVHGLWVNWLK